MSVNSIFDFAFDHDKNSYFYKIGSLRKLFSKDPFNAIIEAKEILDRIHKKEEYYLLKAFKEFKRTTAPYEPYNDDNMKKMEK